MKAVLKRTRGEAPFFELTEIARPKLDSPTSVLIRIASIGVCMSDVHVLHGAMSMPDDNIVGHEYSGEVVEVGSDVSAVKPGDRVVGELAVGACGECRMCRSGRYEFCAVKRPPGWASPGIYAEYAVMEERLLHRIPDNVDFDVAALTEPTAVCVYGCLERAKVAPTDVVVIYGMGSIGLLTLLMLLDAGNRTVICVSSTRRSRSRLELAEELGATRIISSEDDVKSIVSEATGGEMADVVIDCSGAPAAINQGIDILHKDGTFVALGIASSTSIPFDFNAAVLRPITMVFSCTSSHTSWQHSLRMLSRQVDKVRKIVTHRFPLAEWRKAYDCLEKREAVKAVLFNNTDAPKEGAK